MVMALALLLGLLSQDTAETLKPDDEALCDDGSSPWTRDGRPNWRCRRDRCSPHARVCWEERCSDEAGADICEDAPTTKCEGVLACFREWFSCTGKWGCDKPGDWGGCAAGGCTFAPAPAPGPDPELQFSESNGLALKRSNGGEWCH